MPFADLRHFVGAREEQAFKLAASDVISKYSNGGGSARKALYRRFPLTAGFDYGPPRLPGRPFDESNWEAMNAELEALGFWDQLWSKV